MRLLPRGLFARLRAQMILLLAVGLLVVDAAVLIGVVVIQHRVVDDTLGGVRERIERIPAPEQPVTVSLAEAVTPSDLYVAYLGADGEVLTADAPTSTRDVPDAVALSGTLDAEEPTHVETPGGTSYDVIEVPVDAGRRIRLTDEGQVVEVASVVVGYPLATMDQTVRRLLLIELVAGVLVIGSAYALSRWFVRAGLRPLRRILRTAEAIAHGRTDERVEVDERDADLREVASALNEAFDVRQESEDRMRDFVADASHELRTPLASVKGWSDLYHHGGLPDREALDAAMEAIHAEAERMEELVEDMLTLARYDADPGHARLEPGDVAALLADLVGAVGLLHPDHAYVLGDVASTTATADAGALRRALSNLLVNAGRHTPAGTSVTVSAAVVGAHVEVRVVDDGPGLTATEREAAFDRFWRGDRSRRRRSGSGGSGLGLAISRSILRAAGGDLRLEEAAPGGLACVVLVPGADMSTKR